MTDLTPSPTNILDDVSRARILAVIDLLKEAIETAPADKVFNSVGIGVHDDDNEPVFLLQLTRVVPEKPKSKLILP